VPPGRPRGLLAGERLPLDSAVVSYVATGRVFAASLDDGARHVRLVGYGIRGLPEPFDRRTTEILGHTVGVLELLLKERDSDESWRRLRRATADLGLAILQLLMVEAAGHDRNGGPVAAPRAASSGA
jgi:hypothetical protein